MEAFSYLSGVTSVILALGLARILTGVGKILQFRHKLRVYWVHLMWALNVFLFIALNWWILFRWRNQGEWNFFLFLFLILSPTIAFLLTALLFPDSIDENSDLKQHFFHNHRAFFLLAATVGPIDAVDTLLKGVEHFQAQGPIYILTIALSAGLNLVAAFTTNERYHKVFVVFFFLYLLAFIAINLRVLD